MIDDDRDERDAHDDRVESAAVILGIAFSVALVLVLMMIAGAPPWL